MKRLITTTLCFMMLLNLFAGCAKGSAEAPVQGGQTAGSSSGGAVPASKASAAAPAFAEDYAAVLKALRSVSERNNMRFSGMRGAVATQEAEAAVDTADSGAGKAAPGGAPSYSETNVQVEGIDEGDIVKTDGAYIYVLRDYELIIMKADGANTRRVSKTTVGVPWDSRDVVEKEAKTYSGEEKYPNEMYISGDYAVILSNYNSYREYVGPASEYKYENEQYACADIYDISDRSNPVLLKSNGQDGYYSSSRMKDGILYFVTAYHVYDRDEGDPGTFIPRLYSDGVGTAMDAKGICILPVVPSTSYTVVSSIDIATGAMTTSNAILGSGDTVYMDEDSLYIASSVSNQSEGAPYTESVYTVVDYVDTTDTSIVRFDISGGNLSLAATGTIPGYLNNQFSMDEYNGNLRLVTLENRYSYSIYTDETMGFTNYRDGENRQSSNVYVLDPGLNVVGSITGLAENEVIYSARFDGDYGYFCTFERVDPLFAVDFRNPAAPVILSALKIPGFSEYLHVWDDGLLFGLGQNTKLISEGENEWVTTDGLKLSMFDTSDPANVTEAATLSLNENYSEALHNHKAVLVDREKNLIAFAAEHTYKVYGYDGSGFVLKGEIAVDDLSWNARGLYIGDSFYIVDTQNIYLLDMGTLTLAATIAVD